MSTTHALNVITSQRQSYCTQCETDFCTTYQHAAYPGMKACRSCLEEAGADSVDLTSKSAMEAWDSIAKSQGRQLRLIRGANKD